jgi:regulatory protein SWI5
VTLEEISGFISGPSPVDGKWLCLFPSCAKKFGRKENIKSHVQTHLNDRQYQCPTCNKCFVRQHDLKRHAKIHTGIKPYPCDCGNSFARHDALTRQRQRGMCIGAFDGIVRKVVKRGRPRKHRPELDERREKSERTRRKNRAAAAAKTRDDDEAGPTDDDDDEVGTSQSGYSDSSAANSPAAGNDFDGMLEHEDDFGNMMGVALNTAITTMNPSALGLMSTAGPGPAGIMGSGEVLTVVSPEQIHSPSAASSYSHISGTGDASMLPLQNSQQAVPGSPAKSVASHYTHQPGTPPELSASSSPPATGSTTRFFDMDPNSSGLSEVSLGLGTSLNSMPHHHLPVTTAGMGSGGMGVSVSMPGMSLVDEDMLLFTNEDGLVQLDRDLMLGGGGVKYDEDYDAVAMFTNSDDMFFGSS